MPELPEVEALVLDLRQRLEGRAIAKIHLATFSALKTYDPPLSALEGTLVDDVTRHGKYLDIEASGLHLVMHLARAGWIRWRDEVPAAPPKPSNKSPMAMRIVLEPEAGLDVTEAGTRKSLAAYVVKDPLEVPGLASLGPDPLSDAFTLEAFRGILLEEGRKQVKGVLRHQGTIAGIGNAYSDELLHAARMSPYKPASSLTEEESATLYAAIRDVLGAAVERNRGLAGERAQGREEVEHGRARPHRVGLPGVRRHRARGLLRRLLAAVLPDVPDRWQAAGRPADQQVPEVARSTRLPSPLPGSRSRPPSAEQAVHGLDLGGLGGDDVVGEVDGGLVLAVVDARCLAISTAPCGARPSCRATCPGTRQSGASARAVMSSADIMPAMSVSMPSIESPMSPES